MKVEVFDDKKLVCVWLSHDDQENRSLQERLKPLYQASKQKKYCAAVFFSGHEDVMDLTRELLQYNRKKLEEIGLNADKRTKPHDISL